MIRKEPAPSSFGRLLDYIRSKPLSRYRYLVPICFVGGAAFEYFRIFWTPLGINFYDFFLARRKRVWFEDFRRKLESENAIKLMKYEEELERTYGRKVKR